MSAKRIELLQLLESMGPALSKAFLDAISQITSRAQMKRLALALKVGDVSAALEAAGMRVGSWVVLTEAVRNAYIEGGMFTIGADVPKRFGFQFDMNNLRAEEWIRNYSAQLITGRLIPEALESIQIVLQAGLRAGHNPNTIALDIVGRISPRTQRRVGGIIGLNKPQTTAVMNMRTDLENLSMRYFKRTQRDHRFDSIVRRAIKLETSLPKATINKLTGRYSDRLLLLRGKTIGRTEALRALNASSDEALNQIVDSGFVPPDAAKRIWRHSYSPHERPGHKDMSGDERDVNEPFTNPVTGAILLRPGEGPASEVINCRCILEHKIDFVAVELVV